MFTNGLTSDSTAASISVGIAPFLPDHSGFINSEVTDETTPGTGRQGPYPYSP